MRVPPFECCIFDKTQVVYAKGNGDGSVKGVYVVNSFSSTANSELKDEGDYSSVNNLTDTSTVNSNGDTCSFVANSDGEFMYQGNLSATTELPWSLDVTYELDGKQISVEELAGNLGAKQDLESASESYSHINDGISSLSSSTEELAEGTSSLSSGLEQLDSAYDDLKYGISKYSTGVDTLAGNYPPLILALAHLAKALMNYKMKLQTLTQKWQTPLKTNCRTILTQVLL